MKCDFCGRSLPDEAIYCNHCGKNVKNSHQTITSTQPQSNSTIEDNNSSSSRIIGFLLIVLCIISGAEILGIDILNRPKRDVCTEKRIDGISEKTLRLELEMMIIQQKETLPIVISDGSTMTDVELVGKNIVFTAKLVGAKPSDYTQQLTDDIKEKILSAGVFDEDYRLLFREFGYGLIYNYLNENNEILYRIHIYPHEL